MTLFELNISNETNLLYVYISTTGKLVLSEESSVGSVSFSTYLSYMNAAGGVSVAFIVILMYAIAAGSIVFSDWWLSLWIDSITGKVHLYKFN